MSDHLSTEDLLALADGELGGADLERVHAHVGACADCADEVGLLRRTGELIATLPRHEPSDGFAARVVASSEPGRMLSLLRPWQTAAAAALLVAALGAGWLVTRPGVGSDAPEFAVQLSDDDAEAIARDLYLLENLEALESEEAEALSTLVEDLDLLESVAFEEQQEG
jgi:anti-sigma factor RsiW